MQAVIQGGVVRESDAELLQRYERIERGAPGHASGLYRPRSEAELQAVLQHCNQSGETLVISAGRTGLVEAQRPQGDAVLSLERLDRPLSVDWASGEHYAFPADLAPSMRAAALLAAWEALGRPDTEGLTITVQAGVSIDALNEWLEPLGRMFPMEMGSTAAASVGGAAANASAGANALCYGTGAHMTEAAWGFWANGEPAGPCLGPRWASPDVQQLAIDSASLHESWGLLGSQGVFGVISRLRLRSYARPRQREAALIAVETMPEATRLLALARACFGNRVEEFEFMSRSAIDLVAAMQGDAFRLPYDERPPQPYLLLLQLRSDDSDEDLAEALYRFLSEDAGVPDAAIGYGPIKAIKAIRHSITEASNLMMRQLGGGRLAFDTATPIAVFGDYLDALQARIQVLAPAVRVISFGHAGVGGVHLHLLGTAQAPISAQAEALVAAVIDVTLAHGGTFSAEHGIGAKWGDEYQRRASLEAREQLRRLKRRHDPRCILNPRSFGLDRVDLS